MKFFFLDIFILVNQSHFFLKYFFIFLLRYINLFLLFYYYQEILCYLLFKFWFKYIEKRFTKNRLILNHATQYNPNHLSLTWSTQIWCNQVEFKKWSWVEYLGLKVELSLNRWFLNSGWIWVIHHYDQLVRAVVLDKIVITGCANFYVWLLMSSSTFELITNCVF